MESRTLAGAKKSLGTAIKVADSRREIENGKEYPIYLSILGTGKNEGSFQSFQGSVSFQDGVGRVSSNLYKQLGMGASLKVNGDSIELSGKDTDGFSVVANADGISILGRDKEEEELDQDPAQPTASKKEGLKHSGAREAKNLMEKQNSTKMRKQRQDLVAESNRLLDQDFQNTIRGMNRMFRMLMFLEQMNTRAAGTLAQANSLRYAERSQSMAQIGNTHNEVHNIIDRLKYLEKESQLIYEMNAKAQSATAVNQYTNPAFFYTLPFHEQYKVVDAFKEISSYVAIANGLDQKLVADTLFGGLNIDIYDPIFNSKKPTQYVTISSKVTNNLGSKAGSEKPDSNAGVTNKDQKVGALSSQQDSIDLSAYSREQITTFLDKYYPKQCPAGTPDGQKKINKSVRKFFEGLLFSENLIGQNVSNLTLLDGQVVKQDQRTGGYILGSINKKGNFVYSGDLHVGPDGTIEAFELPDGSNIKHQQAKLNAINKLKEEYPEVEQSRISYEVPEPDSDSQTPTYNISNFYFASEGTYDATNTETTVISMGSHTATDFVPGMWMTESPSSPSSPESSTPTEGPEESKNPPPTNASSTDQYNHYSDQFEHEMSRMSNSAPKIDLDFSDLFKQPEISPIDTYLDKDLSKAQNESKTMCQKLEDLTSRQLEERESLEETFSERTMKLVIYELKLSRTELKQQLTEEAGILSKDKSLTPTRRKQLLALKQDEIKKQQQKRLYERIMKQKLEQRQQLAKLLIKQSKDRANLAALVESKLDDYYHLADEIEQRRAAAIDNMSKQALLHLYEDIESAKQRCAKLYTEYKKSGNTQGLSALCAIYKQLKNFQETASTKSGDGNDNQITTHEEFNNGNEHPHDRYDELTTTHLNERSPLLDPNSPHVHQLDNGNGIAVEQFTVHAHSMPPNQKARISNSSYCNNSTTVQLMARDSGKLAEIINGMDEHTASIVTQMFYDLRNPNVVAATDRPSYPIRGINPEQTKPGNNGPIK